MRLTLILLLTFTLSSSLFAQELLIDFGQKTGGGQNWSVTNDGVMGGLSQGGAYLSDSSIVFSGTVSLENNGGFSSLRSPYQRFELSKYTSIELKVRVTGLPFSITFSKSRRFWIPNYKYFFEAQDNEWTVIRFDINDLKEYRVGNPTGKNIGKSDIKNIIGISFFNEGKREGDFTLEVDYILFR